MNSHAIRVVVGEGHPARKGLLRFVLEGEGIEVVGSATTSAELARVLAVHEPDAVVLDDGIGATAVQMSREVSPQTKIVLVWPGAVVPIGGDARVEPSQVLRNLAGTVERVVERSAPVTTMQQPDWVEKVRKDPAALREMLAMKGVPPRTRPSVTELQKRGQRLHPVAATDVPDDVTIVLPAEDDDRAAAVLAIGAAATVAAMKATQGAGSTAATVTAEPERSEINRKLGVLALAGAAVIGAAALSFALSGGRVSPTVIMAERPEPFPPGPPLVWSPPDQTPLDPGGPNGGGGPGPDTGGPQPTYPPNPDTGTDPTGPGPTGPGPSGPGPSDPGPNDPGPNDPGPGPGPDPGPTPGADLPGNSARNVHGGPPGITGVHPWPDGNPGGGTTTNGLPGHSALHNPHGGPPGHTGVDPSPKRHHHKR